MHGRPSSTRSRWRTTGSPTSSSRSSTRRADASRAAREELARARALNARDPVLTRLSRNIKARQKGGSQAGEHPDSACCSGSLYNIRKVRYVGPGWEKSRPRGIVHKRLLKLTLVASCVLALMLAGTAYAQTPTGDTYGGLAGIAQGPTAGDAAEEPAVAAETAADTSGQLPFTGLAARCLRRRRRGPARNRPGPSPHNAVGSGLEPSCAPKGPPRGRPLGRHPSRGGPRSAEDVEGGGENRRPSHFRGRCDPIAAGGGPELRCAAA